LLVSIDLGYGYTKVVSERGRAIFPSVIAPAPDGLEYGKTFGHVMEFRKPGEAQKRAVAVGDLALKEGRAAQLTLSRSKFQREAAVLLSLAAVYLAGGEKQVDVALGLPLAYYRSQKEEVSLLFRSVSAYVSVDGNDERYISFAGVRVFPQAVGALYAQEKLPDSGLLGVIDIGFNTTDFILVECYPDDVAPLRSYTSSVEEGVSTALKVFANEFNRRTGAPLSLTDAQEIWISGRREITFRGRPLDVGSMIDRARQAVGRSIAEAVYSAWSEKADLVDRILLAGGGALDFRGEIVQLFPQAETVPDPQWANVRGFYRLACGVGQPESRENQGLKVIFGRSV